MIFPILNIVAPLMLLSPFVDAEFLDTSIASRNLGPQHPKLSAVTTKSRLRRRGDAFTPKTDCAHEYAEESPSLPGWNSRFAKTETKYKLPALILEDIEEDVEGIRCSESTITIRFSESWNLDAVRSSWDNIVPFIIVTSHIGCNEDGERKPYLVSGIHYDVSKSTVVFSVQPLEWQQAYDTMTVKFGSKPGKYPSSSFRTHEALRRRQDEDIAAVSTIVSAPEPTTTAFSASVDLANPLNSSQKLDPNMLLFEFASTSGTTTESASVSCKGCSLNGTIDVLEGAFTVTTNTTDIGEIIHFIEDGFFQIAANNLAAHIELDTKLTISKEKTFETTLTEIGLPGFSIPNVATVGPFFRPSVVADIKTEGTLEFSYGFDLKVPNNSTLTLSVGNITESKVKGFQNANISATPFQATSPSVKLTLSAGLKAELNLGVVFGKSSVIGAKAEIGAFLDLPSLAVIISTAPDLDVHCDPIATNITLDNALDLIPQKFPSLIKVEPVVVLNLGVKGDVAVNLPGDNFDKGYTTQTILASTSFPLPTACLSFDAEKKELATPTTTPPPPPTTATAPGATVTGGSPGVLAEKPKSGATGRDATVQLWWAGLGLLSVFLVALSL